MCLCAIIVFNVERSLIYKIRMGQTDWIRYNRTENECELSMHMDVQTHYATRSRIYISSTTSIFSVVRRQFDRLFLNRCSFSSHHYLPLLFVFLSLSPLFFASFFNIIWLNRTELKHSVMRFGVIIGSNRWFSLLFPSYFQFEPNNMYATESVLSFSPKSNHWNSGRARERTPKHTLVQGCPLIWTKNKWKSIEIKWSIFHKRKRLYDLQLKSNTSKGFFCVSKFWQCAQLGSEFVFSCNDHPFNALCVVCWRMSRHVVRLKAYTNIRTVDKTTATKTEREWREYEDQRDSSTHARCVHYTHQMQMCARQRSHHVCTK